MSEAFPQWMREKQDWIVKQRDNEWMVVLTDLTFPEVQLHCMGHYPADYAADNVIASSLTKWDAA